MLYERIVGRLQGRVAAFLDGCLQPDLHDSLGGPLNGQVERQKMFRELAVAIAPGAVVETGTFRGETAGFFARQLGVPVYTVETDVRSHYYARRRLRSLEKVHLFLGDSRAFLKQLARDARFPKKKILFYLDAHWARDLPLREEISIIASAWTESVIVADDFQVPDDAGYGFDDYGEGRRLCLEYLQGSSPFALPIFWPSAPSCVETGQQRGCVVLATNDAAAETLVIVKSLRRQRDSSCEHENPP
jgi:hypothetical protein